MIYLKAEYTEQELITHFNNYQVDGVGVIESDDTMLAYRVQDPVGCLKFTASKSGQRIRYSGSTNYNLEYSINGIEWYTMTRNVYYDFNSFSNVIFIRGKNTSGFNNKVRMQFGTASNKVSVKGNIMNLINWENIPETITSNSAFTYLFQNQYALEDTSELTLPSLALGTSAYTGMFSGCTALTKAQSVLPATTLGQACYANMFSGCTSLTSAPELPATTLANYCYQGMFFGCIGLTTAPELPATTLANGCYYGMFNDCTSLVSGPSSIGTSAMTMPVSACSSMFKGCTNLTIAPALPATTLNEACYHSMFYGCTSLTTAPVLPAKKTVRYCYYQLFLGCASLNAITCLATSTGASYDINYWVSGVSSSGTFTTPQSTYWSTGVSGIPDGWTRVDAVTPFNPTIPLSPDGYVIATSNVNGSVIGLKKKSTNQTLYISKDSEMWQSVMAEDVFSLDSGETYYLCGSLTNDNTSSDYTQFIIKGSVSLSGICDYLWSYSGITSLKKYCGAFMFSGCSGLTSCSSFSIGTSLYAMTSAACYYMFSTCTSLTTPPQLLATTLANSCYRGMFDGCISLTTAPELPVMTLANYCYGLMFSGCTSLVTPPQLPATVLANNCYYGMFWNCTSLASTPELPVMTLADYCYEYTFRNCTSLITAPELPATELTKSCYQGMFSGCTNLTNGPSSIGNSATTLAASGCCMFMFQDCTSLTTAPELPATTLSASCYTYMFSGCTNLNYIKAMFTTTPSSNYTRDWVNGVAAAGTFVKNSAAEWDVSGVNGIPTGWTVQTASE